MINQNTIPCSRHTPCAVRSAAINRNACHIVRIAGSQEHTADSARSVSAALRPLYCVAVVAVIGCAVAIESRADDEKKPDSPRALFRTLGVDDGYFDRLADGRSLGGDENETLWRVLFRLRMFPPVDVNRWARESEELVDALKQPAKSRGAIFRLRGRLIKIESIKPSKETAERFELSEYYRCRLELESPPRMADVYTEKIPAEWEQAAKHNASVGADGVFLKVADIVQGDDDPLLVFAAPRLAWYRNNLLGRLGMDWGLLDTPQSKRTFNPKNPADREAFYQMLAAVGRAEPGQLFREAEEDLWKAPDNWRMTDDEGEERYSVVPLFNEPASQRGRLVELFGSARRVTKIYLDKVRDADIIARFGFDHYYEVFLFTDDSQSNPLTFCLRELPEGMPYGNMPHYGETVRIAGFFFKKWNYKVQATADPLLTPGDPKTHQQLSPMLIGNTLIWYPAPKPADTTLSGIIVGGFFLVAMVAAWFVAWYNLRREKKWVEQLESPPGFDAGVDLEQLGRRLDAAPDFSRLAEMDRGPDEVNFGDKDKGPETDKPFTWIQDP